MLKNNNTYFNTILFTLISFACLLNANAQNYKDPTIGISNRIYVQYTDSLVETFYYKGEKKVKTNDELFYYWYAAQDIKHTRGAFEGKLLHGRYTMFYYNKDLLCKGEFKYGLKSGEWKSWHRGGEIKSKEQWKKGILIGKAYYYNEKGKIISERKINSKSGDGYVRHYNENGILISKRLYKNNTIEKELTYELNKKGKLVVVKPSKIKSPNKESKKKSKSSPKDKKVKEKKQKSPKIKIQKFRQISPGGEGA